MQKFFGYRVKMHLAVALAMLHFGSAHAADGLTADPANTDDTGFTFLSNASNVTHWGLGAGIGLGESPYKGYGLKVQPLPLIFFEDKWIHVLGTAVDLKIGQWDHVLFSLRGQYGLEGGYKGSDAPILNGMENRNATFAFGPALAWHTTYGTLSGDFLSGGGKGEKASVGFAKAVDFGSFSIEPHIGAEWYSSSYVDYYYGVRPSEIEVGRPLYTGKASYNESLGAKVDYHLARNQLITVDFGVRHYSSGITDSPLVGKRFLPEVRIGYLYQFK